MKYPESIRKLIDDFKKLPAVGPKTAERYVFYLLKQNKTVLDEFSSSLKNLRKDIMICSICNSVSESNPCKLCSDPSRDKTIICVVSNTRELTTIEGSHEYNGLYHVLGGLIDQINGVGPDQLNIKSLLDKLKNNKVKELVLALSPNMNGESTSLFLINKLKEYNVIISRVARGLPMGSDIEYADPATISNCLKYRNKIN